MKMRLGGEAKDIRWGKVITVRRTDVYLSMRVTGTQPGLHTAPRHLNS